jgi:hypothetical protein
MDDVKHGRVMPGFLWGVRPPTTATISASARHNSRLQQHYYILPITQSRLVLEGLLAFLRLTCGFLLHMIRFRLSQSRSSDKLMN